jgi:NADPH-dependent ferric siderophore reductase
MSAEETPPGAARPRPSGAPEGSMKQLLRSVIAQRAPEILQTRAVLTQARKLTPGFVRIVLRSPAFARHPRWLPADAIKLYLPSSAGAPAPDPRFDDRGRLHWPAGSEPPHMRCATIAGRDESTGSLELDIVRHPSGLLAQWCTTDHLGEEIPVVGLRTEFVLPPSTRSLLLVGDASALPAIRAVLRSVTSSVTASVSVRALVACPAPDRPAMEELQERVDWVGDDRELLAAAAALSPAHGAQAWVCGETRLVRSVRRSLLESGAVARPALHAAAYWRRGTDGEEMFDASMRRFLAAQDRGEDAADPQLLEDLALGLS